MVLDEHQPPESMPYRESPVMCQANEELAIEIEDNSFHILDQVLQLIIRYFEASREAAKADIQVYAAFLRGLATALPGEERYIKARYIKFAKDGHEATQKMLQEEENLREATAILASINTGDFTALIQYAQREVKRRVGMLDNPNLLTDDFYRVDFIHLEFWQQFIQLYKDNAFSKRHQCKVIWDRNCPRDGNIEIWKN